MLPLQAVQVYYPDGKRKNGWQYDEDFRIYRFIDKFKIASLKRYFGVTEITVPLLDNYEKSELPIGSKWMLNLQTRQYREREQIDAATFYLPRPRHSSIIDVYLDAILPEPGKQTLKGFLWEALSGEINQHSLVIQGPSKDLFNFLSYLRPIFHPCDSRLLYRGDLGNRLVATIQGKRLLYADIGEKHYRRTANLRGIPVCVACTEVSASNEGKVTILATKEIAIKMTFPLSASYILAWLLQE